jgi:hypothetical protein
MDPNSAFFKRSLQVVDRFLQTAVVIDDRAFRREERVEALPQLIEAPPTPSTSVPVGEQPIEDNPKASPVLAIVPVPDTDPHGLDAEAVIDSFARRGIVCSVLKRVPDENPAEPGQSARRLFSPADILIIDWQVHREDGSDTNEETLEFVETAVKDSARDTPRQLRLIVVYTGATDLLDVVDKVEGRLKDAGSNPVKDGDFAFRAGAVRVVILGKPSKYRGGESKNQQVANDSDLASRAAVEFAVMTAGLVSNVALSSLAEIRRATHRLLSRFGPHLDAPFLSHRALLDPPDSGNEHLVPLIVSELEAILEDQIPPDLLSDDSIRDWLLTRNDPTPLLDSSPALTTPEKARRAVKEICLMGVNEHASFSIPTQPTWLKKIADGKGAVDLAKLTDVIAAERLADANERLEILMSLRPRYGPKRPALALGSLLSSVDENETAYWLCLQPSCACYIRTNPPRRRAFPLLKLDPGVERFNVLAESDGTFIRLRWLPQPHRQRMVEFEANSPSGAVVADSVDGKFWLSAADSGLKYRWLGDLKFAQAQRVAQAMAGEAARVGLTESEWLRRMAK